MRIPTSIGIAVAVLAAAAVATAGDFDGSVPLLCATSLAVECGPDYECYNSQPEISGIPSFIEINVKKKRLRGERDGAEEISKIERVSREDGQLMLQGIDHHRAWSIVVVEETGRLSASVSDGRAGFVLFGTCRKL